MLDNGASVDVGYACLHASPAFLRQAELFGAEVEVTASDSFNRLFEEALGTAGLQASTQVGQGAGE